jgi:ABC-type xylose transport system permease subunit
MSKVFKVLGFAFTWLAPVAVIYRNHVVLVNGYDVDMFGLLFILVMVIAFIKWVDKKVELWNIQERNKIFILNWTSAKRLLLASGMTWVLFTIEDDLPKIQVSGLLISICFLIGWIFSLWGEKLKGA